MNEVGRTFFDTETAQRLDKTILRLVDVPCTMIENWINKNVKPENRIYANPQMIVPIFETLPLVTDSMLQEMFLNLLVSSCDKSKQYLAHPAFPLILKQLCYHEAILVRKLFIEGSFKFYYFCEYENLLVQDNTSKYLFYDETSHIFNEEMLGIYVKHLTILSILEMKVAHTNYSTINPFKAIYNDGYNPNDTKTLKWAKIEYCLAFTDFGKLFAQACIPSTSSSSSSLA